MQFYPGHWALAGWKISAVGVPGMCLAYCSQRWRVVPVGAIPPGPPAFWILSPHGQTGERRLGQPRRRPYICGTLRGAREGELPRRGKRGWPGPRPRRAVSPGGPAGVRPLHFPPSSEIPVGADLCVRPGCVGVRQSGRTHRCAPTGILPPAVFPAEKAGHYVIGHFSLVTCTPQSGKVWYNRENGAPVRGQQS